MCPPLRPCDVHLIAAYLFLAQTGNHLPPFSSFLATPPSPKNRAAGSPCKRRRRTSSPANQPSGGITCCSIATQIKFVPRAALLVYKYRDTYATKIRRSVQATTYAPESMSSHFSTTPRSPPCCVCTRRSPLSRRSSCWRCVGHARRLCATQACLQERLSAPRRPAA